MRTDINFAYRFHPVGQGLFCTGTLTPYEETPAQFHWTFDCGSMAKKADWISQVEWYRDLILQNDTLNLLCISHFDKDHVSGLAELLKDRHIDTVVIPYYTPVERLVLGSMQERRRGEDDSEYHSFLSNPIAYLIEHAASIRQVVVVHRSPPEGPDWPFGGTTPPDTPTRRLTDRQLDKQLTHEKGKPQWEKTHWLVKSPDSQPSPIPPPFAIGLKDSLTSWYGDLGFVGEKWRLTAARAVDSTTLQQWEFMFFHKPECPDTIRNLIWDINTILWEEERRGGGQFTLADALQNQGIRSKIKNAYRRAFPGGKRFNTAGLCTYSGPVEERLRYTEISGPLLWHGFPPTGHLDDWIWRLHHGPFWHSQPRRPSILYSGDADFTPREHRCELMNFLSADRWREIHVLQVPHHGSQNNWQVGSANEFCHQWSVFSADPQYRHHHPDQPVLIDLLRKNPLLVDRVAGVQWSGVCHFQTATKHLP